MVRGLRGFVETTWQVPVGVASAGDGVGGLVSLRPWFCSGGEGAPGLQHQDGRLSNQVNLLLGAEAHPYKLGKPLR